MSKLNVILLGFCVLNTVRGEEESPAVISQSADLNERIVIQEDLKPNDDSRTINIKMINAEPLEKDNSRLDNENDGNLKRSAETTSPLTENDKRIGSLEDAVDEEPETRDGEDIEIQEHSVLDDENDSRKDLEFDMKTLPQNSDEINVPSLREEVVSKNAASNEGNDALVSVKSEGKSMIQDVMLETKGIKGDSFESWEGVKSIFPEDVRTFNRLKPFHNSIPHRRLSDTIIPNYFRGLSRSAFPPSSYNFQNARPPYFGRLTNPAPEQNRRFENSVQHNTRRTGTYSTESVQDLKRIEEYTDPDSNAYPYMPVTSNVLMQRMAPSPSQNVGFQQKHLPQINPYSNELSPLQYAANYPYGVHARFY